jgi:hypothetical protein
MLELNTGAPKPAGTIGVDAISLPQPPVKTAAAPASAETLFEKIEETFRGTLTVCISLG